MQEKSKRQRSAAATPRVLVALIVVSIAALSCRDGDDRRLSVAEEDCSSVISPCGQPPEHYQHPYLFTTDWFSSRIPVWRELLGHYRDRPNLHYLEIGVWEGRSVLWMLENVLTHPTAEATAVDIRLQHNYLCNVNRSGLDRKVRSLEGRSQVILRQLPLDTYDIVYIDGSHAAADVLADLALTWELVKTGGIIILDDYEFTGAVGLGEPSRSLPIELVPRFSVDAFITANRNHIEIVHRGAQIFLRKLESVCTENEWDCSVFGQYVYRWKDRSLLLPEKSISITLSDEERQLIETLIRSKPLGEVDVRLDETMESDEALLQLVNRLGLKI